MTTKQLIELLPMKVHFLYSGFGKLDVCYNWMLDFYQYFSTIKKLEKFWLKVTP